MKFLNVIYLILIFSTSLYSLTLDELNKLQNLSKTMDLVDKIKKIKPLELPNDIIKKLNLKKINFHDEIKLLNKNKPEGIIKSITITNFEYLNAIKLPYKEIIIFNLENNWLSDNFYKITKENNEHLEKKGPFIREFFQKIEIFNSGNLIIEKGMLTKLNNDYLQLFKTRTFNIDEISIKMTFLINRCEVIPNYSTEKVDIMIFISSLDWKFLIKDKLTNTLEPIDESAINKIYRRFVYYFSLYLEVLFEKKFDWISNIFVIILCSLIIYFFEDIPFTGFIINFRNINKKIYKIFITISFIISIIIAQIGIPSHIFDFYKHVPIGKEILFAIVLSFLLNIIINGIIFILPIILFVIISKLFQIIYKYFKKEAY